MICLHGATAPTCPVCKGIEKMESLDNSKPDENPFVTLQEMAKKQRIIFDSMDELRQFVDNFCGVIRRSAMAPMTVSQLEAFSQEGLRLLRDLLIEETRHALKEQDAKVQMHNVLDAARKPDNDD